MSQDTRPSRLRCRVEEKSHSTSAGSITPFRNHVRRATVADSARARVAAPGAQGFFTPAGLDSALGGTTLVGMAKLTGLRRERAQASPRYRDGGFHNTHGVRPVLDGDRWSIMGEFFFGGRARRPRAPLPLERPHEAWTRPVSSDGLRVTWLGHSTMLLEVDGARVLTDPVFGERASPVGFAGPRRFHPVPATIAELPPLDAVLLSHDHFDHLCKASVRALAARRVPFVTSLGVGAHLEAYGVEPRSSPSSTGGSRRRSRTSPSPRPRPSTSRGAA
jgi:hypothetical protein